MKKSTIPLRFEPLDDLFRANHEPIYMTSSFQFKSAKDACDHFVHEKKGYIYSRFTNPNVELLEKRLAALENAKWCITTASGMSSILTLFLMLLKAGDHMVCSINVFGSTIAQIKHVLSRFDISCSFVQGCEIKQWQQAVLPNTKLFFCETPTNPLCQIIDIQALSEVSNHCRAYLVVDNCFATPFSQNPLNLGADFVVHSLTKHIDGHGRCLGGAILGNDSEAYETIFTFARCAGATLSAMNAWLLLDGLRTLAVRLKHECESAIELARWLVKQSQVSRVYYPGLENHPHHLLAKKQQTSFGNIVAFEVKGGRQLAWKLIDSTSLLSITANLGDVKTSITHPATTTHGRLTDQERKRAGILDNLIRISVGLEAIEDITDDLSKAFSKI